MSGNIWERWSRIGLDVEGGYTVGTRLGQLDFVDVFFAQAGLLGHGILARQQLLDVVADFLGVAGVFAGAEVVASAAATAAVTFADIEFDLFGC